MSAQSKLEFAEIISPLAVALNPNAAKLSVTQNLTERRIYLYIEVIQAVADATFSMKNSVICKLNGKPVATLPADIGILSPTSENKSLVSMFAAGGSPVGDSLIVQLAAPFSATTINAVIQPYRINVECDEIVFAFENKSGDITGYRAFLAAQSTRF